MLNESRHRLYSQDLKNQVKEETVKKRLISIKLYLFQMEGIYEQRSLERNNEF